MRLKALIFAKMSDFIFEAVAWLAIVSQVNWRLKVQNPMSDKIEQTQNSGQDQPRFRIVEGTSPALEFECPARSQIIAVTGAFLAKAPAISVSPLAQFDGFDSYINHGDETEILYLSPSSTGSLLAFDMQLHRKGLILSQASLFAATQLDGLSLLLDLNLDGIDGPYRLYQAQNEGVIIAFMSGDLFPLTLDGDDCLQVDARALAAMETSIAFELEQLTNGQYVASLTGPGRVWLQSMPTQ